MSFLYWVYIYLSNIVFLDIWWMLVQDKIMVLDGTKVKDREIICESAMYVINDTKS